MTESDHARLLLAILGQRWTEVDRRTANAAVDPGVFLDLCRQGDVPTLVHVALVKSGRLELIGSGAIEELVRIRNRTRRDNLLLIARAEQALDVLLRAGVVPIALKGLELLHRHYDSFDERILDDVDLLVRPEQLTTAIEALQTEGFELPGEPARTHYIRSSHHLPLRSPGPIAVDFEIHWNLAQDQRFSIDERGLWQRAIPIEIGGHSVLRLDDHDVVAHLVLHHFTHYFDRRLKWAVDLHAVASAPGFAWETVVERIRAWGATAACGMSLMHLRKLFPEWIPGSAIEELAVARWRRLATWPLRSAHPLDLFRHTRRRSVQLFLAAALMEKPSMLGRWITHRAVRDDRAGDNPLDRAS